MKSSNIVFFLVFLFGVFSVQLVRAQSDSHCGAEDVFLLESQKDESLSSKRYQYETKISNDALQLLNAENAGTSKIIPVVVHVIHEYGPENISKAQILDQIRILNEDFRRTNADTVNTPSAFLPVAADCNIEFKLATIDPNGNCTDGIVRVYSPLTNSSIADGAMVKALSRWPNDKYLNYWVVRTITGGILGYATFPGGNDNVDGIVCGHNYTGSIGTAFFGAYNLGRTATHEVGHWLSLRHIWGDSNCGDDLVADTPTAAGSNFGCLTYPHVSCNNGPNGDMFMNYMDYSDDVCFNIFTSGQSARMNATLNDPTSGRNNLWTQANLIATGTDGTSPGACNLIADISNIEQMICSGDSISFIDMTWNGDVDTWSWSFPGGTPASSSAQNPIIYYNTPGIYNVSLTVTNAAGSDSISRQNLVVVRNSPAQFTVPYTEDFDAAIIGSVPTDYLVSNVAGLNTWQVTDIASVSGSNSIFINNLNNNVDGEDELITATFDLSNVSGTMMSFDLAYATRSSSSTDRFKVFASNDCGKTWGLRYTKSGAALSTAGIVTSTFVPVAGDWRQELVNLSTSSVSGRDHVMFKFQ
ncbi:MAG: PKD domain-containing protein, partial [Bacteroidia bacterium]|nr:PKD domain-containing protein [Bacteroidia bacterium]